MFDIILADPDPRRADPDPYLFHPIMKLEFFFPKKFKYTV